MLQSVYSFSERVFNIIRNDDILQHNHDEPLSTDPIKIELFQNLAPLPCCQRIVRILLQYIIKIELFRSFLGLLHERSFCAVDRSREDGSTATERAYASLPLTLFFLRCRRSREDGSTATERAYASLPLTRSHGPNSTSCVREWPSVRVASEAEEMVSFTARALLSLRGLQRRWQTAPGYAEHQEATQQQQKCDARCNEASGDQQSNLGRARLLSRCHV